MNFAESHLQTAQNFMLGYDGSTPLAIYLKKKFATDKKYGSKDRKSISNLCYCYCRTGYLLKNLTKREQFTYASWLCATQKSAIVDYLLPALAEDCSLTLFEKMEKIGLASDTYTQIWPFKSALSDKINHSSFILSHLVQPFLYLRIRPNKNKKVGELLLKNNIAFKELNNHTLQLSNATNIENIVQLNKDVVVQDLSSQMVSHFFSLMKTTSYPVKIWDCCAASGGKSIMIADYFNKIQLTVSDVRKSILHNLQNRLAEAGINLHYSFCADIANDRLPLNHQKFDIIICDVPCSGSGTWSRTPEHLIYFDENKVDEFQQLQQKIALNAFEYLQKDGYFLYITCSVFKKENEEVVANIMKKHHDSQLIKMEIIHGYEQRADTMFAALIRK